MAQLDYLSNTILRDSTGAPYTSAKASFWSDVGATTPLTVYSDAGLTSALSNPVVADGTTGAFPAIYLQAKRYWRTTTTSAGVSLPQFNSGPIDGFVTLVESAAAPSPTYKLMYWYDTTTGKLKRRDSTNASWLDLGGIDSLINAASVTDQLTGTSTTLASTPDSVAGLWQRGTDIASAATLSLPATGGGVYNITGTTGVTGISSAQGGRTIWLKFAGALTITHNATSMILPGAANITTVAGDMAAFINEAAADASGSNWRCVSYQRSSGWPIAISDLVAAQSDQETGTSTTKYVSPGRQQYHPSAIKAWVSFVTRGTNGAATINSSYNVSGVSRTAAGTYQVTFTTAMSSANYTVVGMAEVAIGTNELISSGSLATTTCNILSQSASAGTALDSGNIHVIFMGDL